MNIFPVTSSQRQFRYPNFYDKIECTTQYIIQFNTLSGAQNIDSLEERCLHIDINVHIPYNGIEYAPLYLNSACYYKNCIVCISKSRIQGVL